MTHDLTEVTTAQPAPESEPGPVARWREAGPGVVFLALGIAVLVLARAIEVPDRALAISPRIWPEALGVGIIGMSAVQILAAFTGRAGRAGGDGEQPATRVGVLRVAGFVLAALAFGVLWYYIHFLVSGLIFVATLTWLAGGRGVKDLILFPAGITVVIYALFGLLLKVPI